jgi:catechol 2,3-dioxygenase-like lactoylglutathione lyase family enzyme
MDLKLEVVVVPVSDVDKAKDFYVQGMGSRLDAEFSAGDGFRIIQVTPPGSPCSLIFGEGVTAAVPGSVEGLVLVVDDVEKARTELVARGVDVSEVFHDEGGVFLHAGTVGRVAGPDPERRTYASFASFADPDGNGWVLQEITTRFPGRVTGPTAFSSAGDLADTLRRAAAAHGRHEERTGEADANWPDCYAEYMVRERAGEELPT